MSTNLNGKALDVAVVELDLALYRRFHQKVLYAIARRTIRSYLAALETQPKRGHDRLREETKQMAALKIGEEAIFPPVPRSVMFARAVTARKLMNNPDARWDIRLDYSNHIVCTRRADGSAYQYDPTRNPITVFIASIPLGESKTTTELNRNSLSTHYKLGARKILKCPTANWKCRTTNKGIKITRIS